MGAVALPCVGDADVGRVEDAAAVCKHAAGEVAVLMIEEIMRVEAAKLLGIFK